MIEVEIGAISHAEPFHHRATADIAPPGDRPNFIVGQIFESPRGRAARRLARKTGAPTVAREPPADRSEEHTSELQSLMRISYAVFCLKKKKKTTTITNERAKLLTHHTIRN